MSTARCSQIIRIIVTLFVIAADGHPLASFPVKFIPGQTHKYIYSTEVALNEPSSSQATPAKKDVGFRFSAEVEVTPVWTNNVNLIRLLIVGPRLHSVAQSDVFRDLKTLPRLPIYFQWEAGRVGTIFGDDEDTVQATNIKKGIISLFQLRMEDGTHSEIDTSGECKVTYEKINGNNKVRKTKDACTSMDTLGRFSQVNELLGVNLTSSFQAEYTVSDDAIKSVAAVEKWLVQMNLDEAVSSVITIKQSLELKETGTINFVPSDSFEALLKTLEAERGHRFLRSDLATVFEPRQCTVGCSSAVDLVGKRQSNFYSNKIGKTVAALMFRDLVKAVREMPKDAILDLLKDKNNEGIILPLIDVVSAAQTPLAQSALMEFLNFEDDHKIDEAERYLLATAMSTHPPEQVLQDLLGLFEKSIPSEKLQELIAAALGAVTNTFYRMKNDASHKAVVDVQTAFLKKLSNCAGAKCTMSQCQKLIIRSLANAGLPDTVDVLLTHAETSNDSGVSEEALRALRRIDRKLITSKVRDRLKSIFHQKKRGFDTAIRSQALSIILETGPTLEEVREIIMETSDPWNTDYSLYIQSKVFGLMQHNCTVKAMVKEILSNPELSNYNFLAPKGKSLAFTSNLAEKPKTTYSMYVENSRSGIMKRSGMDVDIFSPIQKLPLYSVGIFAAGLEGMIADEVDAEEAETEVTAGMALDLIGVSLRPITFFTGKGGLMSAVWSAPSQLVSALQTTFLLQDHSERLHLQNGLIAELDVQGVLSTDLSGKLSVSLWNKNSQSLIRNRGALFIFSSLTVASSSFRTGIDVSVQAESSLDFRTDVDFYDGVKMCLQMSRPDFYVTRNVTKYESARGFKRTFMSKSNRTRHINAISYPLPGPNSETCRLINPE